jgi:S1-C subfamily serine protease
MPTDIIEAINGTEIQSLDHWLSRVDRIAAGESVTLRVRRRNDVLDTKLVAVPNTPAPGHSDLGLRLRASARIGVEVLAVDPHSVGARARILPGDVISAIDGRKISTPREARAAFDAIPERGRALVAITRGSDHHVLIVEK